MNAIIVACSHIFHTVARFLGEMKYSRKFEPEKHVVYPYRGIMTRRLCFRDSERKPSAPSACCDSGHITPPERGRLAPYFELGHHGGVNMLPPIHLSFLEAQTIDFRGKNESSSFSMYVCF